MYNNTSCLLLALTRLLALSFLRSVGAVLPPEGEPALLDLGTDTSELSSSESDSDKLSMPAA